MVELSWDEYSALKKSFVFDPEKHSAPFRFYCDIDGVLAPFKEFPETPSVRQLDGGAGITYPDTYGVAIGSNVKFNTTEFYFDPTIIARLSALSKRDDVDFVWLTSWKEVAPYALDAPLGIQSAGFLNWERKLREDGHSGKGRAILKEQSTHPSKFVWVDDFANQRSYGPKGPNGERPEFFSESDWKWFGDEETPVWVEEHRIHPDQYLAITTKAHLGLTHDELNSIEEWIEDNS